LFLVFNDRPSDSPFIERVWRCHSERAGQFHSIASPHWEMAVSRVQGRTFLTIRGPETKATLADCPADGEWFGIRFKLGTFMPSLPVSALIDRNDKDMPDMAGRGFWLDGAEWEYPDFETAEDFVSRLVKSGLITRNQAIIEGLAGDEQALSLRSTQRHFRQATGMTHSTFRQIERARRAVQLLKDGHSILDTVHEAGFFDQPHMTRALKLLVGQTPAGVLREDEQLSFLYKTDP
jgi:AraC-like DNA-binding protein